MATFPEAPTLGEGAKTWSYLTAMLAQELKEDVAQDHTGSLASADISLEPLIVLPAREIITNKIEEALIYWEKLSRRIPLKREGGSAPGRKAGSNKTFVDFDVTAPDVPDTPPPVTDTIATYRYHLKRLMCFVPRAEDLRGHTSAPSLRLHGVKQYLDYNGVKTPFGDGHLLKELNYVSPQPPESMMRAASSSLSTPPTHTTQRQANHDDPSCAGVGLRTYTAAPPTRDGSINSMENLSPVDSANPTSGGDHRVYNGGVGDGAPNLLEGSATFPSAQAATAAGAGAAEEGMGPAATRARAAAARSTPKHHYSAFSVPCRLVVKFTFCRSSATRGSGTPVEKRIYDVEALGHNTLQQVMEAFPPCLSDRIVDAQREGENGGGGGDERASTAAIRSRNRVMLADAFLFGMGVFYVFRTAEGEGDPTPLWPLPPGTIKKAEETLAAQRTRRRERVERLLENNSSARSSTHTTTRTSGTSRTPMDAASELTMPPARLPSSSATVAAGPQVQPPPEPWMRRWLAEGGLVWNDRVAPGLMQEAIELRALRETTEREERLVAEMEAGTRPVSMAVIRELEESGCIVGGARAGAQGNPGMKTGGGAVTEDEKRPEANGSSSQTVESARGNGAGRESEAKKAKAAKEDDGRVGEMPRVDKKKKRTTSVTGDVVDDAGVDDGCGDSVPGREAGGGEGNPRVDAKKTRSSSVAASDAGAGARVADAAVTGSAGGYCTNIRGRRVGGGSSTSLSDHDSDWDSENELHDSVLKTTPGKGAEAKVTTGRENMMAAAGGADGAGGATSADGAKRKKAVGKEAVTTTITGHTQSKAGMAGKRGGAGGAADAGAGAPMKRRKTERSTKGGSAEHEEIEEGEGGVHPRGEGGAKRGKRKPRYTKDGPLSRPRHNQGRVISERLGFQKGCGGDLVWASDVTVDDLRPALGQRFMFVHHGDCEHHLIISDIRLEPLPPSISVTSTYPAEQGTTCARNAALTEEGQGAPALTPHPRPDTVDARSGGVGAVGGVAGEGGVDPAGGDDVGVGKGGAEVLVSGNVDGGYPRLTFRVKPNVKRCAICMVRAAVYKSFGHPLADEEPVYCCQLCFGMLHYDADGKCLTAEAVGVGSSQMMLPDGDEDGPTRDETGAGGAAPSAAVAGGAVDKSLASWRVFKCFDEL